MLLAIDVGNTEITLGLFEGDRLVAQWRLVSVATRTPDEWTLVISAHIQYAGYAPREIQGVVYGSVAPALTENLVEGVRRATGAEPVGVNPASKLPVVLDVDEPRTVGADRIVNTLAAAELFHRDTIVVDFGTATTFDCITADGRFLGGVIAPGVITAADNLIRRAAMIPATEMRPPEVAIGRRTEDCVRAGVFFGAADAADGIIRRIKAEWPNTNTPDAVATGGLARLVQPLAREIREVYPHLTLQGLRIAAGYLGVES